MLVALIYSQVAVRNVIPSHTSSRNISSNSTATMKGETGEQSATEQGVYYQPTSCYPYYYPGRHWIVDLILSFKMMIPRKYLNFGNWITNVQRSYRSYILIYMYMKFVQV